MWRRLLVLSVAAAGGCWSSDDLIDGTFTPDQWSRLQDEFRLPPPPAMPDPRLAQLGQELFYEPALSGSTVSCATCHDPNDWFIDSRVDNAVSLGAKWTKRNSITVVNAGLKDAWAPSDLNGHEVFTWSGGAAMAPGEILKTRHPGDVLDLAVRSPMCSSQEAVADLIRMQPRYRAEYSATFGDPPECVPPRGPAPPPSCSAVPPVSSCPADREIIANLEQAFDAYFVELQSTDSSFDLYIAGAESALTDSQKRGFAVFVGRGTCISCHSGPLFTDYQFHNTGVTQDNPHATGKDVDTGRASIDQDPADTGAFMTGSLRNIAQTGPYMHDGVFAELGEVVSFYRRGGDDGPYSGMRDARIQPLDLSDEDANDLVNFLGSLTGQTGIAAPLRWQCSALGPQGKDVKGTVCGSECVDLADDPNNCGSCGHQCNTGQCDHGTCPGQTCPTGSTTCGGVCTNLQTDSSHCGTCADSCMPGMQCVMGQCAPVQCPPGSLFCPLSPGGPPVCTPPDDPMNCGSCGHMCAPNQACYMGTCM